MKKNLNLVFIFFIIFLQQSFVQISAQIILKDQEREFHELRQNEVDTFINGPEIKYNNYNCSFKRGSYDSTGYNIVVDSTGKLIVSDLRECNGKHQNEITIFNCSGTISRNADTIFITAKTIYNKFFLFNLEKNRVSESFAPNIRIELISKTLNNDYCPSLVASEDHVRIVALPKEVDTKEIFEPVHLDKTIGIFTYFAIYDSNGRLKVFPEGDYVLIGGNSLKITK